MRNIRNTEQNSSLLHRVSQWTLFVCYRLIGLFPLTGLRQASMDELRLTYKSWYSVIIAFAAFLKIIELYCSLYLLSTRTADMKAMVICLSSTVTVIRLLFLVRLAYAWPRLIQTSSAIERNLRGLQINREQLVRKCKMILAIFVTFAIVNLVFYMVYRIKISQVCNLQGLPKFEAFVKFHLDSMFGVKTYRLWKGIILIMSICQNTFLQDTYEIIIMQVSMYLTCLLGEFNKRVKETVKLQTKKNFAWMLDKTAMKHTEWSTLRVEYMNICKLVNLINRNMSGMVFIIYAQNILLVWFELLVLIRRGLFINMEECDQEEFSGKWTPYNYIRSSYHHFRLAYLITRIFTTSWLAAGVETASKQSELHIYKAAETTNSDIDAERLLCQIRSSTVSLDGLGFFRITKSMILSVLGTIVTYEIMALQFIPKLVIVRKYQNDSLSL